MMPGGVVKLLHLLFAFTFFASVAGAHFNALVARRSDDAARRAALFEANRFIATRFGLTSLLLLGVLGNLVSPLLGYRMAADRWMWWVNGLWLVMVLVATTLDLPAVRKLAAASRMAADQGSSADFPRALARWRTSNALLLVLLVASIALMVFRWRS